MWTEMPKLGWMSSSQTQTISKVPWLRNSHITFESKSSRGKGTSQCGTEGATSAYQGSEFDALFVFFCVLCLWVYDVFMHFWRVIASSARDWQHNWPQLLGGKRRIDTTLVSNEAYCLCADEITQSCACFMVLLFFPHLFTRQHCVQATCC